MAQVDFYVLNTGAPEDIACRLAAKAYNGGFGLYIHAQSKPQAQQLDDQLWLFRPESFIPHALVDVGGAPVLIGYEGCKMPSEPRPVLLNLATIAPPVDTYERVLEVVGTDEAQRVAGRERFRRYRDRGDILKTHQL